jgi:hypothetical protein
MAILLYFILSACAPAATPEHLTFTPGPPAVVAGTTFTGVGFRLEYPEGWRIVTGQADVPQTAAFISPDNCSIILVAVGSVEPITSPDCADEEFQTSSRALNLGAITVTVAGSAPTTQWDTFLPQFEEVASSVESS